MAARTKTHRIGFLFSGMALCGAAALVLSGCASPGGEGDSTPGGADSGLTAEAIIAAVEPEGLECTEEKPKGKDRAQLIVCKGDNYVIITATRLVDASLVDEQIATSKKAVCDSGFKIDGTRFAVSDAWILAPGGGDDKNVATFDAAMNTLGLEWNEDLC